MKMIHDNVPQSAGMFRYQLIIAAAVFISQIIAAPVNGQSITTSGTISSFGLTGLTSDTNATTQRLRIAAPEFGNSSIAQMRPGVARQTLARNGLPSGSSLFSDSYSGSLTVSLGNATGATGEIVPVAVNIANGNNDVAGIELHLSYAQDELTFIDVYSTILSGFSANAVEGTIHFIWEDINNPLEIKEATNVLYFQIEILPTLSDSSKISILGAEIVDSYGNLFELTLEGGWIFRQTGNGIITGDINYPTHNQCFLNANYPNPFNSQTVISFDLPECAQVRIAIYNLFGRKIKSLADALYPAGEHRIVWDGRDNRGHLVSTGIYLCRLELGGYTQTRKMILMK